MRIKNSTRFSIFAPDPSRSIAQLPSRFSSPLAFVLFPHLPKLPIKSHHPSSSFSRRKQKQRSERSAMVGGGKGKPAGGKESPVVIRVEGRDEEGRKRVEKAEVKTHDPDTLRYIERKLEDKGVLRMERHPADGLGLVHLPKSGRGGKYTWEGPDDAVENELYAPSAIDERHPNYVDEEEEGGGSARKGGGKGEMEEEDEEGVVVGEVEVAKVAESREGVARIDVWPPFQP